MNEKQQKQILTMMKAMEGAAVQPEELLEIVEFMLGLFASVKDDLEQKMVQNKGEMAEAHNRMYSECEEMENRMKEMHAKMVSKMDVDKNDIKKQILAVVNDLADLRGSMPEEVDLSDVWSKINDLETKIPTIKDITPYEIRDKLENIDNESEKLRIEAIQNLRKELDEIKKSIKSSGGRSFFGGGFNYSAMSIHIIDDETPSGSINGTNAVFTLANLPNPASSVKVYRGGARQRITEDYTLSGATITFTIAPQVGEIILVDYRT